MKQLLVISLLALSLTAVLVAGDCCSCGGPGRECIDGQCRCQEHYFTSNSTGNCSRKCDNLIDDFVTYIKTMIEQGMSTSEDDMENSKDDDSQCRTNCIMDKNCAGVAVKRNLLSDHGKCFYFEDSVAHSQDTTLKEHKGRWVYLARMCQ